MAWKFIAVNVSANEVAAEFTLKNSQVGCYDNESVVSILPRNSNTQTHRHTDARTPARIMTRPLQPKGREVKSGSSVPDE